MKLLFWMFVSNLFALAMAAHIVGRFVRDNAERVIEAKPRNRISYPRRRFLRKQARKANVS